MNNFTFRQVLFNTMGLWIEVYSKTQYIEKGDRLIIKVYYFDNNYVPTNNKQLPIEGIITIESMFCNNPLTIAKDVQEKIFQKMINLFKIDFRASVFYEMIKSK